MCRTLHLDLWNFIGSISLLQAHFSKSLWVTSLPTSMPAGTQLGVVDKFAEGAFKLTVHITNKMPEDIKL